MDDVGALIEAHSCSKGICHKNTHLQVITVEPADVATTPAEIATLVQVRNQLRARGYQLLESEPTPRFAVDEPDPKSWTVRYEKLWGAAGSAASSASIPPARSGIPVDPGAPPGSATPPGASAPRRSWLSRLWTPER